MRNFKEELLTNTNIVVHCPKKEQAEKLLAWAHSKGKKWSGVDSLEDTTNWGEYATETCYILAEVKYGNKSYYTQNGYKVYTFEEALLPEYTYLETATGDNIPDWWTGKPILVYYSDESEEEAIKYSDKGWLLGIDGDCPECPFIISDLEPDDEYFNKYGMVSDYCTTNYKYVVPVTKTPSNVTGKLIITKDGKEATIELTPEQLKELGL